jgi:conjugative transfer signal peptidase TraF
MRDLVASGAITPPRARRRPGRVLAFGLAGLGLIGFAALAEPAPILVWNATASAPIGLYYRVAGPVRHGDMVLARPPAEAVKLAAERGYLPAGIPVIKPVGALPGDVVCAAGTVVWVGGSGVVRRLAADSRGRALPAWDGCRRLAEGEIFLLSAGVAASFDSRYFGPVAADAVIGRVVPLWTW